MVQGSGFRTHGSGFRARGSGFRAHGLEFRILDVGSTREYVLGLIFENLEVQGLGFRVWDVWRGARHAVYTTMRPLHVHANRLALPGVEGGGFEGTVLSEGFKVGVGHTIESSGLKVQGLGFRA